MMVCPLLHWAMTQFKEKTSTHFIHLLRCCARVLFLKIFFHVMARITVIIIIIIIYSYNLKDENCWPLLSLFSKQVLACIC